MTLLRRIMERFVFRKPKLVPVLVKNRAQRRREWRESWKV